MDNKNKKLQKIICVKISPNYYPNKKMRPIVSHYGADNWTCIKEFNDVNSRVATFVDGVPSTKHIVPVLE